MSEDKAKPSDRRADIRHQAVFPAEIETEGETNIAVIRDLSVSGAQLLTRSKFKVGDAVKLSLYILDEKNPRVVTGKIMRSSWRGSDYSDLWPNSVGIKFDEMLVDCEEEVKAVAEQQAKSVRPKATV
ncbi:MAG: PilZ domain-containing protein [Polyangiaceae bacterium]|nr:PilZ domain-containing protein [Polyangiaceae bacterium]NUQ74311.1 PilZ domain-containing protein [Polyangiaceae bacterium]